MSIDNPYRDKHMPVSEHRTKPARDYSDSPLKSERVDDQELADALEANNLKKASQEKEREVSEENYSHLERLTTEFAACASMMQRLIASMPNSQSKNNALIFTQTGIIWAQQAFTEFDDEVLRRHMEREKQRAEQEKDNG